MEAIAIAVAAVFCLAAIAVWGWLIALDTKKKNGGLEIKNELLLERLEMRNEQDRAFDMARGRDLIADGDLLPDTDAKL
jgi:hypothetical protein